MSGGLKPLQVVIRGRTYQLQTDDDPEYVLQLADDLDQRLQEVEAATKTVDSGRLAVLAALNLADEYCKLEVRLTSRIKELEREQDRLRQMIDDVLEEKD